MYFENKKDFFSMSNIILLFGISGIVLMAGFLHQINLDFTCYSELGVIYIGNVTFWLLVLPYIQRQSLKKVNKDFIKLNILLATFITVLNQIYTFTILYLSFVMICESYNSIDIISFTLRNHLFVNWLAYWMILGVMLNRNVKIVSEPISKILIKRNGVQHKVLIANILWISSQNNCAFIKTSDAKFAVYKSLKSLNEILPNNFVRIHKSTILNLDYATHFKTLKSGDVDVTLSSGDCIRMSRNYKKSFKINMPQVT